MGIFSLSVFSIGIFKFVNALTELRLLYDKNRFKYCFSFFLPQLVC